MKSCLVDVPLAHCIKCTFKIFLTISRHSFPPLCYSKQVKGDAKEKENYLRRDGLRKHGMI